MCKTTVYEKSGREFEREQGEVYWRVRWRTQNREMMQLYYRDKTIRNDILKRTEWHI